MAYTKILVIHDRLDKCVDYTQNEEKTSLEAAIGYALNREKTERTCYETAVNCNRETVFTDMMDTKRRWGKEGRTRKGYHVIQSFPPGEVTPEEAHAVGVEFAQRLFGERYEVIVSTHLNKTHLHNHVVVNSVSFVDGRMYRDQLKDYFGGDGVGVRGTSDAICREHGLSVIDPAEPLKGPVSRAELEAAHKGKPTVRGLIRQDIDAALGGAYTMKSFWQRLAQMGYTVKRGPNIKHATVRPAWGKGNIRLDSLGAGYAETELLERLSAARSGEAPAPAPSTPTVPSQWFIPGRRYHIRRGKLNRPRKLKGFRALYLKYLYLLGAVPKRRPNNRAVFLLREELLKFDRYQEQFHYLMKNRIETATELSMQYDALQAAIDALTDRRRDLYIVRRRGDGGVDGEITNITIRLRGLRRELKLCVRIEGDIPKVRADVAAQRPAREQDRSNAYEKTHQSRPDRNSKAGAPIPAGDRREH